MLTRLRRQLKQIVGQLPQNIMTLVFHVFCNQELYQTTDETWKAVTELGQLFPNSAFLKTQEALLHYHSKGNFESPTTIGKTYSVFMQTLNKLLRSLTKYLLLHLIVLIVLTTTPTYYTLWVLGPNSHSWRKSQQLRTNFARRHAVLWETTTH